MSVNLFLSQVFGECLADIWKFVQMQPVELPSTTVSLNLAPTLARWREVDDQLIANWTHTSIKPSSFDGIKNINKLFPKLNLHNHLQSIQTISPSLFGYRFFRVLDLWLNTKLDFDQLIYKATREYEALQNLCKTGSIVFSSDPWDILTMSMRGIDSCMEWFSTKSLALKGSVLDPGCGIIYLTDGSATRRIMRGHRTTVKCLGSKMLARSIVRVIQIGESQELALLLEKFYYHEDLLSEIYNDYVISDWVSSLFVRYLKQFTNLPIHTSPPEGSFLPNFSGLNNLRSFERSYRDSKIQYVDELD